MKRNKQSTKTMRHRDTVKPAEGKSRYAQKVRFGKQMYEPGCCAHGRK